MSASTAPSSSSSSPPVSSSVFRAVQRVNVGALAACADGELRPVLAALVRMSLIASLDKSRRCSAERTQVLQELSRIELVNNLVALLSIDFHALETDARKELMQAASGNKKAPGASGASGTEAGSSSLIGTGSMGPALEFERSDATARLRLVLAELLGIMGQLQRATEDPSSGGGNGGGTGSNPSSSGAITLRPSELFDHSVYLSEVCDVLCIAMAELPTLLSPPEVSEALLRLKFGPWIICHVVANQPDSFLDVVFHLVSNGDKQDENGGNNSIRQRAVALLCKMNPSQRALVRQRCVESCKLPSLVLQLTNEMAADAESDNSENEGDSLDDIVGFMSGLLLGSDPQIRSWISFFIRSGQKRRNEDLLNYRRCLQNRLAGCVRALTHKANAAVPQKQVVRASALLRLYAALRGIAGMKFSEEEIQLLFSLITSPQPPPTAAGVKFVSLGLCTLLACASLVASQTLERRAVDWIRWLVKEEHYFEKKSGVAASFGEMLLLMSIHFHSNQLSAICDLVCQTLGMKIAIRTNTLTRMKTIFTQEIFTDQAVASHAVKVPVTDSLSANVQGFLSIHCIHQLLKSRAFSKHKVPIKDWIYRQICASVTPLHPVLPALIEVFVNSILVPASSRGVSDQTNEPITEAEVKEVFRRGSATFESALTSSSGIPTKLASSKRTKGSPDSSLMEVDIDDASSTLGLAPQVLTLYYVLLYENVRVSHMKSIMASQRKVLRYSPDLLAEMPIKFLLSAAERDQERSFGGVFPQLLKLCSTQYPHLCLVQDWLDEEAASKDFVISSRVRPVNEPELLEAFGALNSCPSKLTLSLQRLLVANKPAASKLWPLADVVVSHFKDVLGSEVPRQIKDLYKSVWFSLNKVFPRRLWSKTASALGPGGGLIISQEDLVLDPLQVLRCDPRALKSGPSLEIILYMLKACLAASRTHLARHLQESPATSHSQPQMGIAGEPVEREELKNALIATQESAAAQIVLEAALGDCKVEGEEDEATDQLLTDKKEVQSLVCSYLHEAFIAEPNLAKLVHFQGYPMELLAVTVSGVPSMHICLDFAPELLSQPDLEKQIFAVDLISRLSVQYALPKSYSIARLAVNALYTLMSVLSMEERQHLFSLVLPSLTRFAKAFPPLIEDILTLLTRLGKVAQAEASLAGYSSPKDFGLIAQGIDVVGKKKAKPEVTTAMSEDLVQRVKQTFAAIAEMSSLGKKAF